MFVVHAIPEPINVGSFGQHGLGGPCDTCRRYAPLSLAGIEDVDDRPITFSCSKCGGPAWMSITDPSQEAGMSDCRPDPVADPKHTLEAVTVCREEKTRRFGPRHQAIKPQGR